MTETKHFQSKFRAAQFNMFQFTSFCAEKFFFVWLRTCQFIGLLLIDFDKSKDRFYHWKLSSTYCIAFGTIVSVTYPIVLLYFEETMRAHFSTFSFTIFVSIAALVMFYGFMVLSYQQQYSNRHRIQDMMNNFVYFYRSSKETYKEFETVDRIKHCQCLFFISVLIKLSIFLLTLASYFFLLEDEDFSYWFAFLSFPYIVSLAICNQFFLGVLIIHYFLNTINQKLSAVIAMSHSRRLSDINEQLQTDLDKLSNIHSHLFKFLTRLTSFFGYQLLLSIFNHFLALVLQAFQLFSLCLTLSLGIPISWDFDQLILIEIVSMAIMTIDIYFHMTMCIKCMNQVSKFC